MQQEPNKMKPNQKDELEKKTDNEFVRKFAGRNINTVSPQRCIRTSLSVDLMKMSFV